MLRKMASNDPRPISRPDPTAWTFDQLVELSEQLEPYRNSQGALMNDGRCRFLISQGVISDKSQAHDFRIIRDMMYEYSRLTAGIDLVRRAYHVSPAKSQKLTAAQL